MGSFQWKLLNIKNTMASISAISPECGYSRTSKKSAHKHRSRHSVAEAIGQRLLCGIQPWNRTSPLGGYFEFPGFCSPLRLLSRRCKVVTPQRRRRIIGCLAVIGISFIPDAEPLIVAVDPGRRNRLPHHAGSIACQADGASKSRNRLSTWFG